MGSVDCLLQKPPPQAAAAKAWEETHPEGPGVPEAITLSGSDVAPADNFPLPHCDELNRRVQRSEVADRLNRRRFEKCEPPPLACYRIEATLEALDVFRRATPYHNIAVIVRFHPRCLTPPLSRA